jgi:hypothetical protein
LKDTINVPKGQAAPTIFAVYASTPYDMLQDDTTIYIKTGATNFFTSQTPNSANIYFPPFTIMYLF